MTASFEELQDHEATEVAVGAKRVKKRGRTASVAAAILMGLAEIFESRQSTKIEMIAEDPTVNGEPDDRVRVFYDPDNPQATTAIVRRR